MLSLDCTEIICQNQLGKLLLDCLLQWEHALGNSTKIIKLDANQGAAQVHPVRRGLGVGHDHVEPSLDLDQDHLIPGHGQDQVLLTAHIEGAKEGSSQTIVLFSFRALIYT